MKLSEFARLAHGTLHGPDAEFELCVTDSRAAGPAALFLAIAGERVDGHDYVDTALHAGAVATLASRPVAGTYVLVSDVVAALGQAARQHLAALRPGIKVVAITGSVGKTTTKDLVANLASSCGKVVWAKGSFNTDIGLPITVLQADESTDTLVLEMGADAIGDIAGLTAIAPPDIAVVLSVGVAHAGSFGSIEATAKAKSEIVSGLAPGGLAVLNADDLRVAAMADLAEKVVTFGIGRGDISASDLGSDALARPQFTLTGNGERLGQVNLQLIGAHNVYNALAAAAVARELGVSDIPAALSRAQMLSAHRMSLRERGDGITILDDAYNANPDSMKAALRTLAQLKANSGRRVVAVLGTMAELGDETIAAHDAIGRLAVRLNIDWLVVVGPQAAAIASGAQHEGSWGDEVSYVPDADSAYQLVTQRMLPGDIVLLKASDVACLARLADRLVRL